MTSKVLVLLLLVCATSCQQQEEDDGSYSPEKYEKPYENLVDVNPPDVTTTNQLLPTTPPANQFFSGFQQPQQVQPFPPQQPQPSQPPNPFFQQPPSTPPPPPPQPVQPQSPRAPAPNPFPQNPFFQRLLNNQPQPQPQVPSFQRQNPPFQPQIPPFQQPNSVPQAAPVFNQQNPSFQTQQDPNIPPPVRDSTPLNQFIDGVQPIQSTNYQTDDGVQRTETIDSEGNVRGQYSYVDPTGKTITVRYTAGKDGFKVEGDHIPKLPESQPVTDDPQPQPQPQLQPQPQPQPQPQFPRARPRPVPQQFNTIQSQFDRPSQRPRFNNPPPQQFFNPPDPPSDTRSRFVNGIFQPSLQLRNSVSPPQPQFGQENQQSFDFQNQNQFDFQSSF